MSVALSRLDETIPLEETLRTIDDTIEKQQRDFEELRISLLALKSRRNALVPISRLPSEILCYIFSFVQKRGLDKKGREIAPLEWINVTYVCHHWRSVAVNTPSLWVDPPLGHPKWVAEMLRRSEESNLVINFAEGNLRGLELAIDEVHRIKELSMRRITLSTWNWMKNLLSLSAPRLERFCLVGHHSKAYHGGAHSPEPICIPEDILRETGPLRQLELAVCTFNWISLSHLLCSLTHLTLRHLLHPLQTTTLEFMEMFKMMPNLEVLYLIQTIPAYQTVSQLSEEVHLPRLRSLHIEDSINPEIKTFFCNITIPPTTMVKIVCYGLNSGSGQGDDNDDDEVDEYSQDLSDLISGLARSYAKPLPETVFRSLILWPLAEDDVSDMDIGVQLSLFTEMVKDFDIFRSIDAAPRLDFEIYGDTKPAIRPHELTQLLNNFRTSGMLDDITQVCLPEKMPNLSIETIATTLGQLPCVHSLVVVRDAAKSFLGAIVLDSRGSTAVNSASSRNSELGPSFPNLASIFLHDVKFVERPKHADSISTEQLRDILMQRRCDFGVLIDKLFLHKCVGFFAKDKELLREIVVDVETYSSANGRR